MMTAPHDLQRIINKLEPGELQTLVDYIGTSAKLDQLERFEFIEQCRNRGEIRKIIIDRVSVRYDISERSAYRVYQDYLNCRGDGKNHRYLRALVMTAEGQ